MSEKGVTDVGMDKDRMKPVVLNRNWSYPCQLMIFNYNGKIVPLELRNLATYRNDQNEHDR